MQAAEAAPTWPDEIYDTLKLHNIRQVALVPDAGHARADPPLPRGHTRCAS